MQQNPGDYVSRSRLFCIFRVLVSKKKLHFHWRRQEEVNDIDVDGIQNSKDLPRLVFIDEECGNLKVVDWLWRAY